MKKLLASITTGAFFLAFGANVFAASTVVVTPTNTQGWYEADVRPGGAVSYVADTSSPYPNGALQLTTDATNTAKAQYMKDTSTALANVTELGYYTKQVSGPAVADPSYQVVVDLNGDSTPDTTLVYEPYWNGTVTPGVWQQWDVDSGQFWSSKTFTDGTCSVVNGAGGPPFYTLSGLQTACPDAVVLSYGVNVGTYNPNYVVETDGFNFNGTTYDFEQVYINEPTAKDQCKKDGYKTMTDSEGNSFRNQGQCVSYVQANSHANK